MPILREGGRLWTHDLGIASSIGIESAVLPACLAEATERRVPGVFGSPSFGFTGRDLDFLRRLPWLTQVWFWDVDMNDVSGLYALKDLRYFGVHPKRPGVDFSAFASLETVVWIHNPKDTGLEQSRSIKALHLWHYKPRSKSYAELRLPPLLEELGISWANPASLAGLPAMPHLRQLEIHRCRSLASLEELPRIAPRLERLIITTSGRVTQLGILAELAHLRIAIVNGKEILPAGQSRRAPGG